MDLSYLGNPRFWSMLPSHLAMTAVLFGVGWTLKWAIGRGSEGRRTHGAFVFWWAIGCYFLGWFIGPLAGADSANGLSGFAGLSLLAGWLVGTLHGAAVLAWKGFDRPRPTEVGVAPDADSGTPSARDQVGK